MSPLDFFPADPLAKLRDIRARGDHAKALAESLRAKLVATQAEYRAAETAYGLSGSDEDEAALLKIEERARNARTLSAAAPDPDRARAAIVQTPAAMTLFAEAFDRRAEDARTRLTAARDSLAARAAELIRDGARATAFQFDGEFSKRQQAADTLVQAADLASMKGEHTRRADAASRESFDELFALAESPLP